MCGHELVGCIFLVMRMGVDSIRLAQLASCTLVGRTREDQEGANPHFGVGAR